MIAKGDSKRLPRKNVLLLNGKPLLQHNLEKMLKHMTVYVSTEDREIDGLARHLGAKVINRPRELCGDTPDIDVYRHALGFMDGADGFVAVHADTPLVSENTILVAKHLIEIGVPEVMTVKRPFYAEQYHNTFWDIYGSVRAMSEKRLWEYEDPYRPRPEVLLTDPSPEIQTRDDYDYVRCLTSL